MSLFDLEQGKISVRVSEAVYYQLFADIVDFSFQKKDGKANINAFFNQLLPNLVAYRNKKRRELRNYFENNIIHCIKEKYQNRLLHFMDDLFDYSYFDDRREQYHRYTFHFRLTKNNIIKLQSFFDELEEQKQKKTSYLRNLFNEYSNMRKDKREVLCFHREFFLLDQALKNKLIVQCSYNGYDYSLIPYKMNLNYIDGSLYFFSVESDKPHIFHMFRLCGIRNITLKGVSEYEFSNETLKKIHFLTKDGGYTNISSFHLNSITIKD